MNELIQHLIKNKTDINKIAEDGATIDWVWVDRSSEYGNKFKTAPYGPYTRNQAIAKYTVWLSKPEQADLVKKMKRDLKGKTLVCHCAPERCHAEVIALVANGHFTPKQLAKKIQAHYKNVA